MTVSAGTSASRTSEPSRSQACPGVRKKPVGLPKASTVAWILVLNPPRLRPMAWSSPLFESPGAVLMRTHDCAVDHRPFMVGVVRQMVKDRFPNPAFGPTAETGMHLAKVPKPFRQIAPRNAGPIAIHNSFNKQAVIRRGHTHRTFPPRQHALDPVPLIIA